MARASAAAAVAAGVVEPPEVDPELRSISPISTSGVVDPVGVVPSGKKLPVERREFSTVCVCVCVCQC